MKNKKLLIKTFVCGLLLFVMFGCASPKERIKLVLDKHDQSIKEHDSYMREMEKNRPGGASFQETLISLRKMCEKLNQIDASQTPPDFQTTFKKLIFTECVDLNSPSDLVTYEGDPKVKAYNDAVKGVEEISAKYGYTYKHSMSGK